MFHRTAYLLATLSLGACSTLESPTVSSFEERAGIVVDDPETVRFWADTQDGHTRQYLDNQYRQIARSGCSQCQKAAAFLAISGGGEDGAYGAGLLKGWTERRDRPTFEVVTGVSTGAFTAPFAFLGPEYDGVLEEIYTEYNENDLLLDKGGLGVIGESLYDTGRLKALIRKYITDELLDNVAVEHLKGRRLLVQTTYLDAQRPVIWDLGAIAASDRSDRRALFVDVILASAAVPALFPPVTIKFSSNGSTKTELHVDGGVTAQIFFAPPGLDLNQAARRQFGRGRETTLYVIRNGKIGPEYEVTKRTVSTLATRAIETLIKYQSLANINNLSESAKRLGSKFYYTSIPSDFNVESKSQFDRNYMRALFATGYRQGRGGHPWKSTPAPSPVLAATE